MTKRTYQLAAAFFFIFGVFATMVSILSVIEARTYIGKPAPIYPIFSLGVMSLVAAVAIRLAAPRNQKEDGDHGHSSLMRVSRKFYLAVFCLAVLLMGASIAVPNFIGVRTVRSAAPCINFLRQIDGAKQQWQLNYQKSTNDIPTWDDLRPYIKWGSTNVPKCPEGGTYRWGRLDEPPTCSIGGSRHSMPQ